MDRLITTFILLVAFTSSVTSDESEAAKVKEVEKNSTVSYIKYTSNGMFITPNATVLTNHRVAAVPTRNQFEVSNQCGGTFRNLQNLIESPKIISPHPICNLRCEYQIVSPYICENEFHVQFLNFELNSSRDCENDRVIINYNEILCGKIIGVKKFRTKGGVLNITFTSRQWDLKENKNFRLLVTRLPCLEESNERQSEVDSLEPTTPKVNGEEENRCYHVNSSYSVADPVLGQGHTIYGNPINSDRSMVSGRQDIPVLPLPPIQPINPVEPPYYPPPVNPIIPVNPILPPQFLPQCCRNNYNQQRFLMISQGFPAHLVQNNDCIFVIHRSSPTVCKLRIVFKYFLLDDPQPGQFGCVNNFIEIDGQRICGCKTNFVYETLWGFEPKVIRLRTIPGSFANAQGFIFDVIQEDCPFKLQSNPQILNQPQRIVRNQRYKRHFLPQKLFFHQNRDQEFSPGLPIIPSIRQFKSDIDESFKSKFFQPDTNIVSNESCFMSHLKLLQMKFEYLSVVKQFCFPN